jgi:sirohydrochlorin cobaltochelatase
MVDATRLEVLEGRLRVLVPERYSEPGVEVRPGSMASAGLQFGADGRVAWDRMWGSFCDLAMAGGPPHKGTLLTAGSAAEIAAEAFAGSGRYGRVVEEICRGVALVTGMVAEESPVAGWVRVACPERGMAGWLLRAITMENVAVRSSERGTLDLPAGPGFRVEKEIKNVVTVIAKTTHYWRGHMGVGQREKIAELLEEMGPPVQAEEWVAVEFGEVGAAVRGMRLLVAENVLARREGTAVMVGVGDLLDRVR